MSFDGSYYPGFWLILAIVLFSIEIFTLHIVTVWFAIGALFSLLIAFFDVSFPVQMLVFIVTSALLLYFTRPIAKKYLFKKVTRTNADRFIGEEALVIETIHKLNGTGKVKISGLEWSAVAQMDEEIQKGETVKILKIAGVKLIVEKKKIINEE